MSTHTSEHHHGTAILKEIAVDYCPEVCLHSPEDDEIHITFDHRGGARWRSHHRFQYGTFGGRIKCPAGNTSGLNFNIYLSSLEGDKSQVIYIIYASGNEHSNCRREAGDLHSVVSDLSHKNLMLLQMLVPGKGVYIISIKTGLLSTQLSQWKSCSFKMQFVICPVCWYSTLVIGFFSNICLKI